MRTLTTWILLLFISQILCDQDGVAFYIHEQKKDLEPVIVSLETDDGDVVSCIFSYSTLKTKQDIKEDKPKSPVKTVKEVLVEWVTKHQSKCFERGLSGWNYKVCIGEDVKQFGAEMEFHLGDYAGVEDSNARPRLIYNGGQSCEAIGAPRATEVRLTCGTKDEIQEVSESSTCRYEIVLRTPDVCGVDGFPQVVARVNHAGPEESWYLQLVRMFDSSFTCSVQHTGIGKKDDDFHFADFSLQFESGTVYKHKARRMNRAELNDDELLLLSDGIKTSSNFKNTFQFASISRK
eukprot:TRINITY_DN10639_c0_g1_i1.p1 TRINITY_DN10639_c0_g1~~TRINITY_DN10639_c0_g1_i1.p1  ORF type:complete len:292 (-),score=61.88 TRINITY_DN10639_c0_g1_i1:8-883(-)